MPNWDTLEDIGNVGQIAGVHAVGLIGLIVDAANRARLHKKNCKKFAHHLKLIGNLLEQLKITELKKYPETSEPLEQLEEALKRAYLLVHSCQDKSYLYLLAMGWSIVNQFKRIQDEIDRYLRIMPLLTLVSNARFKERLEHIQNDQYDYTLEEEDRKMQVAILNKEPSMADTVLLKKTLSCSYPSMRFEQALLEENEKLQMELQRSQSSMNVQHSQVIEHLIEVTEAASRHSRNLEASYSKSHDGKAFSGVETCHKSIGALSTVRNTSIPSPEYEVQYARGSDDMEDWHTDLLDCCSKPKLCLKTFFFPCGTFSRIASVANNKHMSSGDACNELTAYSLVLSCCCYTCCIRKKLRKILNVKGGACDDFLSHLLCCCCSLVQEWREVEIRGVKGPMKTMAHPPSAQQMEF
ncbi:protein MID1-COMPLEMENTING ACTIVITY 1-like [Chenopodium quinoa]|uniref:protein MID1-COMPLEMENTING ACTIVITY 1-like n=1 Tax=Chenopodium quinoa TaxID=63459 RepID=UPI000B76FF24|nr:protein MID1-COMPLEMENTING ACTIVITY 1-like [Chenopodium quinoa]